MMVTAEILEVPRHDHGTFGKLKKCQSLAGKNERDKIIWYVFEFGICIDCQLLNIVQRSIFYGRVEDVFAHSGTEYPEIKTK